MAGEVSTLFKYLRFFYVDGLGLGVVSRKNCAGLTKRSMILAPGVSKYVASSLPSTLIVASKVAAAINGPIRMNVM